LGARLELLLTVHRCLWLHWEELGTYAAKGCYLTHSFNFDLSFAPGETGVEFDTNALDTSL